MCGIGGPSSAAERSLLPARARRPRRAPPSDTPAGLGTGSPDNEQRARKHAAQERPAGTEGLPVEPDPRPGKTRRPPADRAASRRPPAGGRRAGTGQDQGHQGPRRRPRDLPSGDRHLRVPARPDLPSPGAGRRDQPRPGQGAIGAARSHGRAPGFGRPQHLRPATAVPGDGDTEPDRAGRYLPVAGSPARPLPHARQDRLPGGLGGTPHPPAGARPGRSAG